MGIRNCRMEMKPETLLDYWYSERVSKMWFAATPELDAEIKQRFESLWEQAAAGELSQWAESAEGTLALVILLDQLPLNMFRNEAKSFQTEQLAVRLAKQAIARQWDTQLTKDRLAFLYMPLMHSEDLADQELSVSLFERAGLESNLRFAKHHRQLIRQYGRFPHRNRILKRQSTSRERDYLSSKQAFKG